MGCATLCAVGADTPRRPRNGCAQLAWSCNKTLNGLILQRRRGQVPTRDAMALFCWIGDDRQTSSLDCVFARDASHPPLHPSSCELTGGERPSEFKSLDHRGARPESKLRIGAARRKRTTGHATQSPSYPNRCEERALLRNGAANRAKQKSSRGANKETRARGAAKTCAARD